MIYYTFFILLLLIAAYLSIRISLEDFAHRIIPDKYLFPLLLVGLILISYFNHPITFPQATIGATFGYTVATLIGILFAHFQHANRSCPPAIGMGDIKLIGVGGLWLGTNGLALALIIACITGAIWARAKNQKFIPFAPFFLLGGILSLIANLFLL